MNFRRPPTPPILLLLCCAVPALAWWPFGKKSPSASAPAAASAPASAPTASTPEAAADAGALTARAREAYANGELTLAGKLFEQAAKRDPRNPSTSFNAGIFFMQTQDPSRAGRHLKRTLKLDRDHALAWYYLGLIAEKGGDPERAVDLYSEAARRDRRVLDPAYNKEVVQSRLTMDVRLRRYLEGDRPLDFAAVASSNPAPAAATPPKPVAEPPKPKPPAPPKEISVSTKPDPAAPETPKAKRERAGRPGDARPGERGGRGSANTSPAADGGRGGSTRGTAGSGSGETGRDDVPPEETVDEEEYFPPLPPVNGIEWRLPDIDRP